MEGEEIKKQENSKDSERNQLPDINAGKRNQFFDLDDFNSDEKGAEDEGHKDNVKDSTDDVRNNDNKKQNNFINTNDKFENGDEKGSLKNGTATKSDNKGYSKDSSLNKKEDMDDTPYANSKMLDNKRKEEEKHEAAPEATEESKDEVVAKPTHRPSWCNPKLLH